MTTQKPRRNIYFEPELLAYVCQVQETQQLSSFTEAVNFIIGQHAKHSHDNTLLDVLSDELVRQVTANIKQLLEPIRLRTGFMDKQLKIQRDILNHYFLFANDSTFAGEIIRTEVKRSRQIAELDQKISDEIMQYKQRSDERKGQGR